MLVLLYHRIHPKFGVKPQDFKRQVLFLKKHLKPVNLEEAERAPRLSFLITFDDGFYDNYFYAYPILKELQVPAVIFVPPERLLDSEEVRRDEKLTNFSTYEAFKLSFLHKDNFPFLSWGELREMGDVFSVQSHGLTHRAAPGRGKPFKGKGDWRLFSLSEEERKGLKEGSQLSSILVKDKREAKRELSLSKELIEKKLGVEVKALAFPWGIYDKELLEIAKRVGYRLCFTTERGWNLLRSCKVKRLAVSEKKSFRWFKIRSLLYSL